MHPFRHTLALEIALATASATAAPAQAFDHFISRNGSQLLDGSQPLRFLSFNIPNLTYIEDDMRFDQRIGFRLPEPYEIDDALATIHQMGGQVARTYVLSVRKASDPAGLPRHILGPGQLNEDAMVLFDEALAAAHRHQVRLILPFIDENSWWGGIEELAAFRGKPRNTFYSDPQLRDDYKQLVSAILNRVNTRTGIRYCEDKAILAWELGNELRSPKEWVREMASHLKQLDPRHLIAESYFTDPENAGVDIVQDHLYQGDPVKMLEQVRSSVRRANGQRVYLVGEFGFVTTEGMRAVMDEIQQTPAIAGGLIWSLRFHNADGGYYWHHEPFGGDFFKAYHWPGGPTGEPYDETRFMRLVREHAYALQHLAPPRLSAPKPPTALAVTERGLVTWRGSTGASSYDLQRADVPRGAWQTILPNLTADAVQYGPLATDESAQPGRAYRYRLLARNEAGPSRPSVATEPVLIRCHTLVDELRNLSHTYRSGGKPELRSNDARNYKEDCHRLRGEPGDWIAYHTPGPITAVRVQAFGEKEPPELEFRVGNSGPSGPTLTPQVDDFYAGKEMYDFKPPRRFTLTQLPPGTTDVTLVFRSPSQVGRIEIEFR